MTTFVINMLICRAYGNFETILDVQIQKMILIMCVTGSVLSAFFEKFDNIVLFSLMYDYFGVALSGAYLSLG